MQPQNARNGIVVGIVSSLKDDDNLGRVRVRYPLFEDQESEMARVATLMAGGGRGSVFLPEPGDEVLVAFEQNESRRPYIVGSLWSKADRPPEGDGDQKANNRRFIRSRAGAVIGFDDKQGAEKVTIIDKDGQHRITLDSAAKRIEVVTATGSVSVSATSGSVSVEAATIELKATGELTLNAGGALTIKGASVAVNPPTP